MPRLSRWIRRDELEGQPNGFTLIATLWQNLTNGEFSLNPGEPKNNYAQFNIELGKLKLSTSTRSEISDAITKRSTSCG